jgi:hypothetical protein
MIRWATSHTASIAPTISCFPTTIVEAFKLGRNTRIDQCGIRLLEDAEQLQSCVCRDDVLSLRDQKILPLQPTDDFSARRRRAYPLGFFQASRRTSSSTKRQAFCIASIRVPSL